MLIAINLTLLTGPFIMNVLHSIHQTFLDAIATLAVPAPQLPSFTFELNVDENKQQFGDITSNAAMVVAKTLGKSPREVAGHLIAHFKNEYIEKVEIAGPGFLNFFLTHDAFNTLVKDLTTHGDAFFTLDGTVPRKKFNIEFVSANPTGPLHLGSGRGGIIGDVLSNVVAFIGHTAVREYYINDAGSQITKLGQSLKVRCQELTGLAAQLPEDGYAGTYMIDLAQQCINEYGVAVIGESDAFFATYATQHLLSMIKNTLTQYGITYDCWFSEKTLHEDGSIQRTLQLLHDRGHLFEHEGALWFRATTFGDDKDRVMRKASGEYTYVAADAAYLKNKADRGFDTIIMVLGHDHHGYVERLQGLRKALGYDNVKLDVILNQLVKMKLEGEQVKMSKRAGTIVTLSDVIETVGQDVARFFYLNKKADAQLEFDLDLALKKTEENPVFYIQYAFVRIVSIIAKAQHNPALENIGIQDAANLSTQERFLIKKIVSLKQLLVDISLHYQTHLVAHYAIDLATAFHRYYAAHRVIDPNNIPQTRARLLMIRTVGNTLSTVFKLLKISQPTSM